MSQARPISLSEKKRRLIESIRLLASDGAIQLEVLPDFVQKPDEIALIFDETRRFLDELENAGLLTSEQVIQIESIDTQLNEMSGQANSNLWTIEAVKSDAKWASVRMKAIRTLQSLSCTMSRPNIDWMTFIK